MLSLREFVLSNKRFIIAHRGASVTMIENTMPAFERAVLYGAKVIEIDIQVSEDGVAYAYHDTNLKGIGLDRDISGLSSAEISQIALRSKENSLTHIPRLDEIVDFAKQNEIYLVIEVKLGEGSKANTDDIDIILRTIEQHKYTENCLFASFDIDVISYIRAKSGDHNIAAIAMPNSAPKLLYEKIRFDAFICSMEQLSKQLVDECRDLGVYLGVYSADNEEQLDRILKFGINAIVTNYPEQISALLTARDNS